jgi:hypothetical protein
MFPWGLLSTTVVGLGGIGGAILTARMTSKSQVAGLIKSIEADKDSAMLTERRTTYAECIASFTPAWRAWGNVRYAESEDQKQDVADKIKTALTGMYLVLNKVRLIAPREVREPVEALINGMNRSTIGHDFFDSFERLELTAGTAPVNRSGGVAPIKQPCPDCGKLIARQCVGSVDRENGSRHRCHRPARRGTTVCGGRGSHGGNAPQVKALAARRVEQAKAVAVFERYSPDGPRHVDVPADLAAIISEVRNWQVPGCPAGRVLGVGVALQPPGPGPHPGRGGAVRACPGPGRAVPARPGEARHRGGDR